MNQDIASRYDEFQAQAVLNVTKDFRENPAGRYLLVIPTGGGKTVTAVKCVCEMFDKEFLGKGRDKVLWVAHREELVEQAKSTFARLIANRKLRLTLDVDIQVASINEGRAAFANNAAIKLIVIDEAHHAAAPSYQPFFGRPGVGVLGLTATPSRHDGSPLDFERESYSIGFPDLVKRGVILRPTIHKVEGVETDIDDLTSSEELNKLNTADRNKKIIEAVIAGREAYQKVIVYVGTKEHARALCDQMKSSPLSNYYDSISYVVGEDNSRGLERKAFFAAERKERRSIIVNVQVLTEGYDDPSINTVVMAAPSRSKLYYMQALGRALRHDPNNDQKSAYVVEIDDRLPNIRYRIDNRWLFSDVSDALEPAVIDAMFSDTQTFDTTLQSLFNDYNVPQSDRHHPAFAEADRFSVLLFKQYRGAGSHLHRAVVIHNENRARVVNAFNYLSERATQYVVQDYSANAVFTALRNVVQSEPFLGIDDRAIFDAITNAAKLTMCDRDNPAFIAAGSPWITFCSFQFRLQAMTLPECLRNFVNGMTNEAEVLERIERHEFADSDTLLKLPLPLAGSYGLFVTSETAEDLEAIRHELVRVKEAVGQEQADQLGSVRDRTVFPLELKYFHSMTLIVRESLDYQYALRRLAVA